MEKVVDVGALRNSGDILRLFLSASSSNRVVLSDYSAMESLKGDGIVNLRANMDFLANYPDRVLVLRPSGWITKLKPRSAGLRARLIDSKSTAGFPQFCENLLNARSQVTEQIRSKEATAKAHFNTVATHTEDTRNAIIQLATTYAPEDLKLLRSGHGLSATLTRQLKDHICMQTAIMLSKATSVKKLPPLRLVMFSFPFRYALCCSVLGMWWIEKGGLATVPVAKLRNDLTDMTYAAYATFFDGILTRDRKLEEIYALSRRLLDSFLEDSQ